jgi:hypothetical protein
MPDWVPENAVIYLAHVESGCSIRSLARDSGVHASTILRKVRQFENRRDDVLVDLALRRLGHGSGPARKGNSGGMDNMQTIEKVAQGGILDDAELKRAAPLLLRRLNETGACLAIARDMDKAVIVRDQPDGTAMKTAVIDRHIAEALALKDWIQATGDGRILRYRITNAGRMALKRFLAEEEAMRIGMGEASDPFTEQHRDWVRRKAEGGKRRGIRYNAAESPLVALSRRKDKDGNAFLSPELVAAGERLREDFELAQMGPRVTQNWDKFLTGGVRTEAGAPSGGGGSDKARDRVMRALGDLGPGLGDVVLRCCCFLEGLEQVERRMGWSARSGKIVLRIALHRLKVHYDEANGNWSPLIG